MKRLFYNFKITLKNKELIFWTFAFPIVLGSLFFAAFSNIKTADVFVAEKVAIVESENNPIVPVYEEIFKRIGDEKSEDRLIEPVYEKDLNEAKTKLENDEVTGIVLFEDGMNFPKLIIQNNGITQTLLRNILTEAEQSIRAGKMLEDVNIENTYEQKQEFTMIEYFSLFAMTCLYGAMIATKMLDKNLANMTASGKRVAIASISKLKIILSSLFPSYITQLIGLAILFFHMAVVLGIDFGENLLPIFGFTAIGAIAGLSLGVFISSVFKVREDTKDGITTGYTMLNCFFAGMMGPQMKYLIDANVPLLNKINPVAMITDGYYAITNFGIGERFWFDVCSLLIFSAILSFISVLVLRRQKYDKL